MEVVHLSITVDAGLTAKATILAASGPILKVCCHALPYRAIMDNI
jgi:hypothetical protein